MAHVKRVLEAFDREASEVPDKITQEQSRIRENMRTVGQATQYYERLLGKLNEQESSIETLQKERDGLVTRRDALRKQLDEYLSNLTIG